MHPMLVSLPFREFVLHAQVSPTPVVKQSRRKMLMARVRRLNRRPIHIIAGVAVSIALVILALYLGFIPAIQQLLLIPLAALVTWVIREVIKSRRDAQTPPTQEEKSQSVD